MVVNAMHTAHPTGHFIDRLRRRGPLPPLLDSTAQHTQSEKDRPSGPVFISSYSFFFYYLFRYLTMM